MEIKLEFDERFREPILNGDKVITARRKPHAYYGDTFKAFGATFRIIAVLSMPYKYACILWRCEGFDSIEECQEYMEGHFPDKRTNLYLHMFVREL